MSYFTEVKTVDNGLICTDNSSETSLGISGVFTGAWEDSLNYNIIIVGVIANEDSATDGLVVEWSADGVSATQDDVFSILADNGKVFTFSPPNRYFRVKYTNGAVAQTSFSLQTTMKKQGFKPSSHRINDAIVGEDDAELTKSQLTGEDVDSGDFVNVGTKVGQVGNNLLVSLDQVETTTNSLKVIDYSHAELHSGTHYVYRRYHSISKNGVFEALIVTPNTTKWAHMTVAVDNTVGEIAIDFFEDTVVSANGTLDGSINRNRNYTDNNTTLVYDSPTVTSDGTQLSDTYLGAGKNLPGGAARDSEELILKQNTNYLVRITEQNIGATIVNLVFDWYEHTNK